MIFIIFLEIGGFFFKFLGQNPLLVGSQHVPGPINPGQRQISRLTVSAESSEIMYKIDLSQFCLKKHIINKYMKILQFRLKMIFSCSDSVSVSSMKRNNENLMILGCFVSITHNSQSTWRVPLETLVSGRNSRVVLVQLPVQQQYRSSCIELL